MEECPIAKADICDKGPAPSLSFLFNFILL